MLTINQPRVSHLDRASRIWSTISLDKAAAWYLFISGSSLSGLSADFLNYRRALSNPTPQRRVLCSRRQTCRGRSQSPVVWIAEEMETKPSKPIDKVSSGEATSHRAV